MRRSPLLVLFASFALGGCNAVFGLDEGVLATGTDSSAQGDTGVPTDDSGLPSDDSGSPLDDTGTPGDAAPLCDSSDFVVNEVQLAGASDGTNFLELYSNCDSDFTLGKWGIKVIDSSANESNLVDLEGLTIPAHGFVFLAQSGYSFAVSPNLTYADTLSKYDGVGLFDESGHAVDTVAWKASTYAEGTPAQEPGAGQSIGRIIDGADTDDNANDFVLMTIPSPGASNIVTDPDAAGP